MRLIFLNRFFWPDHAATSQLLTDLAFGLADASAFAPREVIVITSRLSYSDPATQLPAHDSVRGVRIVRVWSTRFGRGRLLGRAVDYVTFMISAAWMLARLAGRGDVVVIKTDPPLLCLVAHPVARLKGARVVNWLQDIYPEVASALGMMRGPLRPIAALLAMARTACLRRADVNVVLGARMATTVRRLAPAHRAIITVPNWADGEIVRPVPHDANTLRTAWGLQGAFVVAYSGNLGRAHEVETLLMAMQALHSDPEAHSIMWLFIGGGTHFEALRAEVSRRGLARVMFKPYQPRAHLAESLSVADVHLVSLRPSLEGLIVPSKVYGVLAAGRPALFIGAGDGDVAELLRDARCGGCVAPDDGAGLAALLGDWRARPGSLERMGRNARAAFDAQYDKRTAIARWTALLETLQPGAASAGRGVSSCGEEFRH